MGDSGSLWMPESVSTLAPTIDNLFYFVTWVSTILFIGVVAGMVYLAWKYRRRSAEDVPEPVKESKVLEATWIVLPTLLVLVTFNWGFKAYIQAIVAPPDSYEIQVRGKQWLWEFEYPNGAITTNELRVPIGRPVKMIMSSTDVLHSFFVPAFRVKQDVLPNRYSTVWFQATKEGEYDIYCTEYCGTQHSGMLAKVMVQSQDEFNEWLESGGGNYDEMPLPEYGEVLYTQQVCNTCHSVDGSQKVGPTFQGLYGKTEQLADGSSVQVDDNYLREAILEPGASIVAGYPNVMPASYGSLNERQVSALIAYIKAQQ